MINDVLFSLEDDVPPNQTALGLTSQLMQNPQVLAALQSRMDGIVGTPSGYIQRYNSSHNPNFDMKINMNFAMFSGLKELLRNLFPLWSLKKICWFHYYF